MATKLELRRSLTKWSSDTRNKIRQRIVETDTIDTGDLLRSIESSQPRFSGSSGWYIDFSMLDYGKYTDLYNPRVKKLPVPPRNFFFKLIENEMEKLEDEMYDDIVLSIDTILEESGKLRK